VLPSAPHPQRIFFCRQCDRRIESRWPPPSWLNLRRHIVQRSVAVPAGLAAWEQRIYARRSSIGLGLYCGWPCLMRAMERLERLCAELNAHAIGMRRLKRNESPAVLPAHAIHGEDAAADPPAEGG
jgi:hypothetical protein